MKIWRYCLFLDSNIIIVKSAWKNTKKSDFVALFLKIVTKILPFLAIFLPNMVALLPRFGKQKILSIQVPHRKRSNKEWKVRSLPELNPAILKLVCSILIEPFNWLRWLSWNVFFMLGSLTFLWLGPPNSTLATMKITLIMAFT